MFDAHVNAAAEATKAELENFGTVVSLEEAARVFRQAAELWSQKDYDALDMLADQFAYERMVEM
jgi:predicted lipid-binding transport protein (Tim44 family)